MKESLPQSHLSSLCLMPEDIISSTSGFLNAGRFALLQEGSILLLVLSLLPLLCLQQLFLPLLIGLECVRQGGWELTKIQRVLVQVLQRHGGRMVRGGRLGLLMLLSWKRAEPGIKR